MKPAAISTSSDRNLFDALRDAFPVDLDATEDEAALGAAVLDVQILTLVH